MLISFYLTSILDYKTSANIIINLSWKLMTPDFLY